MTPLDPINHFRLFVREAFLDQSTCADIVTVICSSKSAQAALYGRGESSSIDNMVRRSLCHELSPKIVEFVMKKLMDCATEIEKHFLLKINECENPQFLRYRVGDFFVAHQDGNTGLLRLDQESRRVSVVIFLSHSHAHRGGELVFHDYRDQRSFAFSLEKPGTLIAFPAEITHEVTPVIIGERFSIACWYR